MHLVTAKSPYAATLYQVAGPVKHNIPTKFVERGGNFAAWMAGTSPAMTRRGCGDARHHNRFRFPGQPYPSPKETRRGRYEADDAARRPDLTRTRPNKLWRSPAPPSKPDIGANWRARRTRKRENCRIEHKSHRL